MSSIAAQATQHITKRQAIVLGGIFGLSSIGLVAGRSIIPWIVNQFTLIQPVHPYFPINEVGIAYLVAPLIILFGILVWIFPGVFLILAFRQASRFTELIIKGFGLSFVLYVVVTSVLKLVVPEAPTPEMIVLAIITIGIIAWGCLLIFILNGKQLDWPFHKGVDQRRLIWSLIIPLVGTLLLFPVLFWQDMHGDGIEALELGRSLTQYILPRFPTPTGVIGLGAGMLPVSYPIHWFIVLFGELEVSARLPFLLYLSVIFCMLLELIEFDSPRKDGWIEEALLLLALVVYSVAMSFNASYYPYFSDIASPTAVETLTILFILGSLLYLWKQNSFWFLFFALSSYLCRPTGLLILGLFAVGVFFFLPEYRKRWLPIILGTIVTCFVIAMIYDRVLLPWISGTTEFGYPTSGLIDRVRYIRWIEPYRINFGLFTSGILPFVSLFFFAWQDRYARMVSFATLVYFVMFFFFAFIAMHHFVPVMLWPLIVMWRIYLSHPQWNKRITLPIVTITALISLGLSLPKNFDIFRSLREISAQTRIVAGDYDADYWEILKHHDLFNKIILPQYAIPDPSEELAASPLSIIYYASQPKVIDAQINIVVQPSNDPAPQGWTKIAEDDSWTVYIHEVEKWKATRIKSWRTDYQSPLYEIPQSTLFYFKPAQDNTRVFDLMHIAGKFKDFLTGEEKR